MDIKTIEKWVERNSSSGLPIMNKYLIAFLKAYFIGSDTEDSDYKLMEEQVKALYNQFTDVVIDSFIMNFYYDDRFKKIDVANYRNVIYTSIRDTSFNMLKIISTLYYSAFCMVYSDGGQHKSGYPNYYTYFYKTQDENQNLGVIVPPIAVFNCCFYILDNVADYKARQKDYLTFVSCAKAGRLNFFQEMQLNIDCLNVNPSQITFNINYIEGLLIAGRYTDEGHYTDETPPTYTDYDYDIFIESMEFFDFTFIDDSTSTQAIIAFFKEVLPNGKTRRGYRVFYPQNKEIKRLVLRNHGMEVLFDLNMLVNNYIPSFTLDSDRTYLFCYFDL
jgi:hypothetical protein